MTRKSDTETSGPVFLRRYVGGTLLTMAEYPSAQAAMLASDEGYWISNGSCWHSQDGRTVIEPPRI
jgi:hypothetical protein